MMIKKYVMIIAMLLVILMFTSTSTASFLFPMGKIYEMLPENSPLKNILDRLSQVISNNNDIVSNDADEEDDEDDDMMDTDDPLEEDVLLPETIDIVGEITPHEGNYIDVDDSEETTTIDLDGEVGATQGEWTVDSDGDEGAANNEVTIDESEWTVDHDGEGGTLERFVKIITEHNEKFGGMLQRVVERTFAPGTTESDGTAENDIVGVVVEGGSGGTTENNVVDAVVLTDGDQ